MASTAAPTYFSTWNITIDRELRLFMDGALCANNPTHFVLVEAAELAAAGYTPDLGLVLSLGCGQAAATASLASQPGSGWTGLWSYGRSSFDMLQGLFNLITDTDMTHEVVKRMLKAQVSPLVHSLISPFRPS